ncbi:MAG TPA: glycosyltransferase family 2 protein [Chloroflexota bacterium]
MTTVLPTYRRPQLLKRAIESVLAQTYISLHIHVYDNASGDETEDVVRELASRDSRVIYTRHPENIGHVQNFQQALQALDTELFAFLSDDDVLLPGCYQTAIEALDAHPEAGFAANRVLLRDERGHALPANPRWQPGVYEPPEGLLRMLSHGQPVWTATVFRTKVFELTGYLDTDIPLALDSDFLFRCGAYWPYVLTDTPGAVFTAHSLDTRQGMVDFDLLWPANFKMASNIGNDERLPLAVRTEFASRLTGMFKIDLFWSGLKYAYQGRFEEAQKAAAMLRQRYPLSKQALTLQPTVLACRHVPGAHQLLRVLVAARAQWRQTGKEELEEEFQPAAAI